MLRKLLFIGLSLCASLVLAFSGVTNIALAQTPQTNTENQATSSDLEGQIRDELRDQGVDNPENADSSIWTTVWEKFKNQFTTPDGDAFEADCRKQLPSFMCDGFKSIGVFDEADKNSTFFNDLLSCEECKKNKVDGVLEAIFQPFCCLLWKIIGVMKDLAVSLSEAIGAVLIKL